MPDDAAIEMRDASLMTPTIEPLQKGLRKRFGADFAQGKSAATITVEAPVVEFREFALKS